MKRLAVINDLQMALLALPEMTVGENASPTPTSRPASGKCGSRTSGWSDPPASRRQAPEAVYPPDGGQAEGTDFAFRWSVPKDPDGDKIADYHFVLANRPDMRWPLSTNFYKLISRTADKGKRAIHAAQHRPADRRQDVLLARAGQGRQGRLGPVEQDL